MEVSFQNGLKESKRVEYAQLSQELENRARNLFKVFPVEGIQVVCVDESITKRTEFSVNMSSNRMLAYLGDARLSMHMAECAFQRCYTAKQHQDWRTSHTSDKHLANVFDDIFGDQQVILHFVNAGNTVPSVSQKATFMEALIGYLPPGYGIPLMNQIIHKKII